MNHYGSHETMTKDLTKIGIYIPQVLREGMNEVCAKRGIPDRAEYIRSLIREDLEREGVIKRGEV